MRPAVRLRGAGGRLNKQQPAITVNGQVVDSNDMPIVGATVYIKDEPGTGNITNSEGRFTLKAKLYNTLVVSFVLTRPSNRYSPRTTT